MCQESHYHVTEISTGSLTLVDATEAVLSVAMGVATPADCSGITPLVRESDNDNEK